MSNAPLSAKQSMLTVSSDVYLIEDYLELSRQNPERSSHPGNPDLNVKVISSPNLSVCCDSHRMTVVKEQRPSEPSFDKSPAEFPDLGRDASVSKRGLGPMISEALVSRERSMNVPNSLKSEVTQFL